MLETPEYPTIPESENVSVGSISREELAWLAGIMDSDGTMGMYTGVLNKWDGKTFQSLSPTLAVTNTDPRMVAKVSEIFSKLGLKYYYRVNTFPNRKPTIRVLTKTYGSVKKILDAIYPFLVCKRDQAAVLLDYVDWRLGIGNNPNHKETIRERAAKVSQWLKDIKAKKFNPQRLQRRASTPLIVDDGIVWS